MILDNEGAALADIIHAGDTDKAGDPYWFHVYQVAQAVPMRLRGLAWLHDVSEDHAATWNPRLLVNQVKGDEHDFEVLTALTRRPGERYRDFIQRIIAAGADAIEIKIADIRSNLDPKRLAKLMPSERQYLVSKYGEALRALTAALAECVIKAAYEAADA